MTVSASDPAGNNSGGFLFCSAEHILHKRLRENPPEQQFTDLQHWLNSTTDIRDLSHAVLQNTTIQEVCLLIHESFAQHSTKDILRLFRALGGLPRLEKLLFNTYRFPFVATLPIQAFTNVFQKNGTLVTFKLWRCDLRSLSEMMNMDMDRDHHGGGAYDSSTTTTTTASREMERWAQALGECKTLKEFRLVKCRLTDETRHVCTLDPVLQALATLPNLQEIELSATERSALGSVHKTTLRALFRSTSLLEAGIRNFEMDEGSLLEIAHALLQQQQQQHQDDDDDESYPKKSSTTKKTNSLSIPKQYTNSSKIQHLKLSNVTGTAAAAGGGGMILTKAIREAFCNVLQSNYNLESMLLFDERNLQLEIAFYTKLNRLGRNRLLQDHHATRHDWLDILVQVKDDLGCLFYFLSMNPLLCSEHREYSSYKEEYQATYSTEPAEKPALISE